MNVKQILIERINELDAKIARCTINEVRNQLEDLKSINNRLFQGILNSEK